MALSVILNSPRLVNRKVPKEVSLERSLSEEHDFNTAARACIHDEGKSNQSFGNENGKIGEFALAEIANQCPSKLNYSNGKDETIGGDLKGGGDKARSDPEHRKKIYKTVVLLCVYATSCPSKLNYSNGKDETIGGDLKGGGDKARSDPEHRKKIYKTVVLLCVYATSGLIYGQMGPTLPDLQRISGEPLEKASWIFTGFAIGYLVGCLAGGILIEKINEYLFLFLITFGIAITTVVLPWIPNFIVMVINRVITGCFIGSQDTAVHTVLLSIWSKEGGRFIHVTHVLAAVGGMLSPLITEPFVFSDTGMNSSTNQTPSDDVTSNYSILRQTTASGDITVSGSESNIHYAFLITAIITATAACTSLVVFLIEKQRKSLQRQISTESIKKAVLQKNEKLTVLCILFANSFFATAFIDAFPSFLTTFLIEQLHWTQSLGTILTAIFFGAYGLGNMVAVLTHNHVETATIIVISYSTSSVTLVALLLAVIFKHTVLVWITVSVIGLTSAVLLPTLITWAQEMVTPVTGRIASALLFSGSAGVMTNPLVLGYLMDNVSPMWFIFVSLGEIVACVVLFTIAYSLRRVFIAKRDKVEVNTDKCADESDNNIKPDPRISREIYIVRL